MRFETRVSFWSSGLQGLAVPVAHGDLRPVTSSEPERLSPAPRQGSDPLCPPQDCKLQRRPRVCGNARMLLGSSFASDNGVVMWNRGRQWKFSFVQIRKPRHGEGQ